MITPILICSRSGLGLWPLSHKSYPNQFANILDKEGLLQPSARWFISTGQIDRIGTQVFATFAAIVGRDVTLKAQPKKVKSTSHFSTTSSDQTGSCSFPYRRLWSLTALYEEIGWSIATLTIALRKAVVNTCERPAMTGL